MKIKEITINEYDEFNAKLPYYNLFQTSTITNVRKYNYEKVKFLGLFLNNELKGTTQFLIEPLPYIKKKMATSIKGLNFDLEDDILLKAFKIAMKKYLKKNNILFFRMDFYIAKKFYNAEFEEIPNIEQFPCDNNICDKLERFGYVNFNIDPNYMGRSPQWSMLVNLQNEDTFNKNLNRSAKRAIKLAQDIGIEVIQSNKDSKALDEFYKLHLQNAQRNGINILDKGYYKELIKDEHIKLYLVKINKDIFEKYTQDKYSKSKTDKNLKLCNLAKDYKNEYILGHIVGDFNGLAYDMFTGLNYTYKDLGTKEYLMKAIFKNCIDNNIRYYDFWGIVAGKQYESDPMYPIYLFKKKFASIIVEYPGFWDIYSNKLLYYMFVKAYKIRYQKNH